MKYQNVDDNNKSSRNDGDKDTKKDDVVKA